MRNLFDPNRDIFTPEGAMASAKEKAADLVGLARVDAKTQEAAIRSISREYRLGTFLKKLIGNEPVTIHLDKYCRLCLALEKQLDLHEKRIARKRQQYALTGKSDETMQIDLPRSSARMGRSVDKREALAG